MAFMTNRLLAYLQRIFPGIIGTAIFRPPQARDCQYFCKFMKTIDLCGTYYSSFYSSPAALGIAMPSERKNHSHSPA